MKPSDDALIYNTEAIVIRRVDYGDHDVILTVLTRHKGKLSVMAKNARKSVKRFSGILELFYALDMVVRENSRMAYLQEAALIEPFENIRQDILKTAYASYFSEIVNRFLEEGTKDEGVYDLLFHTLADLDSGERTPEETSLFFQLKFLGLTGHNPELAVCLVCKKDLDSMDQVRVLFDIGQGGILCKTCGRKTPVTLELSKGMLKQMIWYGETEPGKTSVIRFSRQTLMESLRFLERFLPFHLEKELMSLKFLNTIRGERTMDN
jgi:DNA repair protein RecO (recombination protein O)